MTAVDVLVDALAAYRVDRLLVKDKLTEPVRDAVEARSVRVVPGALITSRIVDVQPWAFLRDLLDCPWCTGVWVSFTIRLLPRWMRRALALAAVAGLLSEWVQTLDQVGDTAEARRD